MSQVRVFEFYNLYHHLDAFLSLIDAANQQDLIYKRSQDGITEASVTIVFDNSDRSKNPVGYIVRTSDKLLLPVKCVDSQSTYLPDLRIIQIALVPDVSKYLLNGHKALQEFSSSQFN